MAKSGLGIMISLDLSQNMVVVIGTNKQLNNMQTYMKSLLSMGIDIAQAES
jgi:hypothetical protein